MKLILSAFIVSAIVNVSQSSPATCSDGRTRCDGCQCCPDLTLCPNARGCRANLCPNGIRSPAPSPNPSPVVAAPRPSPSSSSSSSNGIQWQNNWAMNCDFSGNDLSSSSTAAPDCGPKCEQTPQCTHFTYNTMTRICYLKQGTISKNQAIVVQGAVCGVRVSLSNQNSGGSPGGIVVSGLSVGNDASIPNDMSDSTRQLIARYRQQLGSCSSSQDSEAFMEKVGSTVAGVAVEMMNIGAYGLAGAALDFLLPSSDNNCYLETMQEMLTQLINSRIADSEIRSIQNTLRGFKRSYSNMEGDSHGYVLLKTLNQDMTNNQYQFFATNFDKKARSRQKLTFFF